MPAVCVRESPCVLRCSESCIDVSKSLIGWLPSLVGGHDQQHKGKVKSFWAFEEKPSSSPTNSRFSNSHPRPKCKAIHQPVKSVSVLSLQSGKSDVSVKFVNDLCGVCVLRQSQWALSVCGAVPQGLTPLHWSLRCSGLQPNSPNFQLLEIELE